MTINKMIAVVRLQECWRTREKRLPMGDAKKILIVDDNRTMRMWLEKRLSSEGYKVFTAGDGKEGLAVATREVPDLIVTDVDMPVMDGGEMAAKLKGSVRTSNIPIVFLTGLITKAEGGLQPSGEGFYVSKMCKPGELLAVIRERLASV